MITDAFDNKTPAIRNPKENPDAVVVDACIVTFSYKIEEYVLSRFKPIQIGEFYFSTGITPVWLIERNGKKFAFFKTYVGAPACVGSIEDSFGCIKTKKYILFGGAGCLDKEIAHGKVMVPNAAWRDEGTSYHYMPASDWVDIRNFEKVSEFMKQSELPFVVGKTWTTDAINRETQGNFAKHKAAGCISVEMESAAVQAMCDFRGLDFYVFFTSGDLLDAPKWQQRHSFKNPIEGTKHDAKHFEIALELADFIS
ncbi:MAG: nucleoside phosphorylase [Alphaproteobacteria bacterium]|nr:nucleoside phosphorylase [Alphaproteobacteria bacterium]